MTLQSPTSFHLSSYNSRDVRGGSTSSPPTLNMFNSTRVTFFQAERERDITVEHLVDIDRLVNESLQMLSRFQDLNTKILPLMEDYLIALRSRDNTPASLLRMDKQHEEEMINNYTSDIKAKIQGTYRVVG